VADRTSAGLFGLFFDLLAENPTEEHKTMAQEIWRATRAYDFSPYQMDCDDSLLTLGLARKGLDPKYPEEGEILLYGEED